MIWWIFPAAIGFFGLVVVLTGLARFGKLRVFSGLARLLGGGLVITSAGLLSVVGLNLQTYARLTHEETVAYVELARVEAQHYTASVRLEGQEETQDYAILGDEIEFQARVIKWKPWANIIGYDAVYRLDRMQGQYSSIKEDLEKERTVYPLRDERGLDVFALIKKRGGWLKTVDAFYGSGTYVPMIDGAAYQVIMTQNGLITRPDNDIARNALRSWMDTTPQGFVTPMEDDGTL